MECGLIVEPVDGLRASGRYFENEIFDIGLHFSLGNLGITAQTHLSEDGNESYQTYGVRIGAYDRTFMSALSKSSDYVHLT